MGRAKKNKRLLGNKQDQRRDVQAQRRDVQAQRRDVETQRCDVPEKV